MKIFLQSTITLLLIVYASNIYTQNSESYKEKDLSFTTNGITISGKLITPWEKYEKKLPLVVFVHGSGPEDYSSSDNYRYLFEQFTEIGFACYSWNRQGVGSSEGKWHE